MFDMLNLAKNIKFLKLKYQWANIESYKKFMWTIAAAFTIFFGIICFVYSQNIEYLLYVIFGTPIITVILFYYYPAMLKKQYVGKLEKDLPFFLIELDMKLSIGEEFIHALQDLSKKYDFLGKVFERILDNYHHGIPLQKSFREFSEFFESRDFTRALTQIKNLYETGKKVGEKGPLFDLAEEIVNIQTTTSKLYSNKLVMISLIFIGVTTILPSLLLIFVNIGSFVLDLGITPTELILIFVLLFPAIDLIIIFILFNMMPSFLR